MVGVNDVDRATSEQLWAEILGKYFVVAVHTTGYVHSIYTLTLPFVLQVTLTGRARCLSFRCRCRWGYLGASAGRVIRDNER